MNENDKIGFSLGSILKPKQMVDFSAILDKKDRAESLWVPESWGKEAFSTLGAISQVTKRIKLGTSIINIYSRSPATIAMGAISLDNYSNNRTIIGLGTSTQILVENLHGIPYEKPVQRMKEYIESIRLLIKSNNVNYDGQIIKIRNFKLLERSRENIPIYIAAVNNRMIHIGKKYANGILFYLKPKDSLQQIINELNEDNSSYNIKKLLVIITSVSNHDPDKTRKRVAKTLAFYIGVGNIYYKYFLNTQYKEIAEKIYRAYHNHGITEASSEITSQMLEDLTIFGSVNECIYRIKKFQETGIFPILQINPIEDTNGELGYRDFADL